MDKTKKLYFELVDGRIQLKIKYLILGEWFEFLTEDVTDSILPIVDDFHSESLNIKDYKYINNKLVYVGDNKKISRREV